MYNISQHISYVHILSKTKFHKQSLHFVLFKIIVALSLFVWKPKNKQKKLKTHYLERCIKH